MHRPGIEPGAGRHSEVVLLMATANFTTKPPMLWKPSSIVLFMLTQLERTSHRKKEITKGASGGGAENAKRCW
jgi:hypothetical protein